MPRMCERTQTAWSGARGCAGCGESQRRGCLHVFQYAPHTPTSYIHTYTQLTRRQQSFAPTRKRNRRTLCVNTCLATVRSQQTTHTRRRTRMTISHTYIHAALVLADVSCVSFSSYFQTSINKTERLQREHETAMQKAAAKAKERDKTDMTDEKEKVNDKDKDKSEPPRITSSKIEKITELLTVIRGDRDAK